MKTLYTFLLCWMTSIGFAQIDRAEYFIDDIGNTHFPITINSPGNSVSESFSIDTTPLSNGIHTLYVRAADASDAWSLYYKQTFLVHDFTNSTVATQINKAEYFIDSDPGTGNGTSIAITPGFGLTEAFSIDTTPLSNGIHTLYVRTKDEDDRWSLYFKHTFLVHDFTDSTTPSQIIAAEYFIDTDLGTDNGSAIAITPGFSVSESLAIPAAISDGIHTLYIRTKDADDRWSLYFKQTFLVHTFMSPVQTQINKAEYFFDTDPGVGMGQEISITPGFDLNENLAIPSGGLSEDFHHLYIRVRDENGVWSLYEVIEFEVTAPLGVDDNLYLLSKVYPVPASDELTIDSHSNTIESVKLYDLNGKEINTFDVHTSLFKIDVSPYAKGIYILQVKTEKGLLKKKIIIE